MAASVCVEIEATSYAIALSAAKWLPGFYPQVSVEPYPDAIELRSHSLDSATLANIWAAAFANERLHAECRERRAAAFERLAR